MEQTDNIHELRKAANFLMVKNRLRPAGISGIIFGAWALLVAAGSKDNSGLLILLIGLFLVGSGIYLLVKPSPRGMLLNGIGFALIGLWNIFGFFFRTDANQFWLIMGALQLKWAFDNYRRFTVFTKLTAEAPAPETVTYMNGLVKDINASSAKNLDYIIEFIVNGSRCKGRMLENMAVFVLGKGQGIFVAWKADVYMERAGEARGKSLPVNVHVGNSVLKGAISPEHLDRYQAWKDSQVPQPF